MFKRYATATIIGAEVAKRDAFGLVKTSHRATFDYTPREGFLYARSRMISSRCNDNYDEFPAEEIKAAWKTAIGKPVFVNHHNEDHRRMRGVIVDAALHEDRLPDGRPDVWIEALHEIDARRFPKLAQAILEGRVNRTSMGTDVGFSVCSACGNKASTPAEYCDHIPRMKGKILYRHTASGEREGHLIREVCYKLGFFENSFLVEDPADPTAVVTGVDDRGLKATAGLFKKKQPDWHVDPDRSVQDLNNNFHLLHHLAEDHGWGHDAFQSAGKEGFRAAHDRLHNEGVPGMTDDDGMHFHASRSLVKEAVPEGIRFHFTPAEHHPSGDHHIRATVPTGNGRRDVGYLQWDKGNGMVTMVKTEPDMEGQGIASKLWHRAHEVAGQQGVIVPRHSDVQTPQGMNWSRKVDQEPINAPGHGQQSLFEPTVEQGATDLGLPTPMHDDLYEHLQQEHGGFAKGTLEQGRDKGYLDKIHENAHKYDSSSRFHIHAMRSSLPSIEAVRYEKPTDHPFFQDVKLSPKHIVAAYDEADEPTKAQGMRWYSDAHHIAKSLDPDGDAHRGAGVLAAYSPRSAWPINLFNASNTLKNRRAVRIGEGMNVMGQHAKSAARLVEENKHYFQVFTTPKITDFAHLIAHGGDDEACPTCKPHRKDDYPKQAVVVDRHALSVAAGRRMSDNDIGRAPLGTRKFYEHVADQYRKAARQISDRDGTTVHPHQLQAITWLQQQKRNAVADAEESFGGKGRQTRDRNAWNAWEQHARDTHPDLMGEEGNIHLRNPHHSALNSLGNLIQLAYGETRAPQDVDTLRTESCPVCGENDAFDGDRCQVCNFIQPPAMFTDPDTGVARQMDLKKDTLDQQSQVGPDGQPIPGQDEVDPNDPNGENQPMTDMPGMAGDQIADLFCPACGFSADTQEPMTNNDPSMPSEQQGLQEGDVCPNCGNATMLSPNDVGEMGGEVPQEIADDADADGVPDDQEPDEDQDGIPDQDEPDVDNDGKPDDAERDSDDDGTPDDADPDDQDPTIPDPDAGEEEGDEDAGPVEDEDEAPKGRKDKRAALR